MASSSMPADDQRPRPEPRQQQGVHADRGDDHGPDHRQEREAADQRAEAERLLHVVRHEEEDAEGADTREQDREVGARPRPVLEQAHRQQRLAGAPLDHDEEPRAARRRRRGSRSSRPRPSRRSGRGRSRRRSGTGRRPRSARPAGRGWACSSASGTAPAPSRRGRPGAPGRGSRTGTSARTGTR